MRILDSEWRDGFLDYALTPGSCRIRVRAWRTLAEVKDLYFSPARDWRLVFNYWREFGTTQVIRKISSRRGERSRNKKFLSCGVGEVMEMNGAGHVQRGDAVCFLAPSHPRCVERIVLPLAFVKKTETRVVGKSGEIRYLSFSVPQNPDWLEWAGWNEHSGIPADAQRLCEVLNDIGAYIQKLDWSKAESLPSGEVSAMEASTRAVATSSAGLNAVLFGYGHYAKTNILPNLASQISVTKVHEIDPTQLGPVAGYPFTCDTAPGYRECEKFDVAFIAGYHHTHAPLAKQTLDRGGVAVVEKPVATAHGQLHELLDSLRAQPGRFFAGFHKRYSSLNRLAFADLGTKPGDPISYHCIVHEVELPALHWYRWPNSCSRLVSNGCHWIDHFLFVNDFATPVRYDVQESAAGEVCAWVELENGAFFTMALTDRGSSRIGVEDYIELRHADVTVRIANGATYLAENSRKRLRRAKVNRTASYADMYRTISDRIVAGAPGDTIESVERSTSLVLALEERLQSQRSNKEAKHIHTMVGTE